MFFFFFFFFHFLFSFFREERVGGSSFLFSCISSKYFLLLALVSEFNCFLRSRCSMEMWCPDDTGLPRLYYCCCFGVCIQRVYGHNVNKCRQENLITTLHARTWRRGLMQSPGLSQFPPEPNQEHDPHPPDAPAKT